MLTPHFRSFCAFSAVLILTAFAGPVSVAEQLDMEKFEAMKPRSIGPAGMSGRVTAIDAVHGNPDIIYAGTASGGLWRSTSGGVEWEPIFDEETAHSIGAVAINQSNPDVIWVGTGEGNPRNSVSAGNGLFKTIDGGSTWTHLGLDETRSIHRILLHPDNSDMAYIGALGPIYGETETRGVFKTTDGGESFEKILYENEKTGVGDMVMDPSNPDHILVGMWEFRRWPWFFKSGGPGSALHVTYDGGKTWKRQTDEDGLPDGELGRIGLAFAQSDPNVAYALVEAEKNALFRSTNGGDSWTLVNDSAQVTQRPFYYQDIFVDSANENRLYHVHSVVSVSDDAGLRFTQLMQSYGPVGVHPDHHAFWIDPTNKDYIIEGNDGGLNISRDRGKTWRFAENLPVAQFYHINVDMELPYNVMGGMQDNGSWVGPAYVWKSGGIRNSYWQEVAFGDGFDVSPDPENSRFGYAMSQGGSLSRYDKATGNSKYLKPLHPDGEILRFNWNAGFAQDPFDASTVYYGSQFLHKSTDKGNSWSIISPDLTTNDPEKQKQLESGGLTYDVTQAENFTTIVSIGASRLTEGVLWVGTDDGNIQLTRDGGETWENVAENIRGVDDGSWVTQINPSTFNEAEAFAVIEDHRRNNWRPYVYRTRDWGQRWEPMLDRDEVWGYALSIVQDPIEEKLFFLGTEFGLYVSVDGGEEWAKWTNGYPTASTMDLVIHPREHDLVIGTFGRSAYVLDDIRPLRAIASEGAQILDEAVHVFEVPEAYLASNIQASGTRFRGNAIFAGANRPTGARLTYSINSNLYEPTEDDKRLTEDEDDEDKDEDEEIEVEIDIIETKRRRDLKRQRRVGLDRFGLIEWHHVDDVVIAAFQAEHARVALGHIKHLHLVEMRLRVPIMLVRHQHQLAAAFETFHLEGAGADGLNAEILLARFIGRLVNDIGGEQREGGEKRRERRLQRDLERLVIERFARHGRKDVTEIAFRVGRLVQGKLDVVHGHRLAIAEFGLPDVQGIDQLVVGNIPGLSERGTQAIARIVRLHQGIADLLNGPDRTIVRNGEAIHGERLLREGEYQRAAFLYFGRRGVLKRRRSPEQSGRQHRARGDGGAEAGQSTAPLRLYFIAFHRIISLC